ncbi:MULTISPECIES: hypothetical protein [Bradyrhizobium]|uniref:hypothetical protein n=1 Tax=Bradyrhizobium TaxID=374 RepID=UPI002226F9C6|nr:MULTISPECIES: hypothetical protein [Bradyrhizobium]MCW2359802.1 hypothetical protein [Bradyrhizobium elkanii]MDI2052957.1 hypothetical protein [Bradyrhizobium sp. Mp19]
MTSILRGLVSSFSLQGWLKKPLKAIPALPDLPVYSFAGTEVVEIGIDAARLYA